MLQVIPCQLATAGTFNSPDTNYNCPVNPNIGSSYIVCTSKTSKTGILVMDISPSSDGTLCVIAAQASNGYSIVADNAGNAVTQCGMASGESGLAIDLDAYAYTASALNAAYIIKESDLTQFQACLHGTDSCPSFAVGKFR